MPAAPVTATALPTTQPTQHTKTTHHVFKLACHVPGPSPDRAAAVRSLERDRPQPRPALPQLAAHQSVICSLESSRCLMKTGTLTSKPCAARYAPRKKVKFQQWKVPMISSFLPAVVHWQAIGPLLRVGARYIFMDQLLALARLMNPARCCATGPYSPAGRSRIQKCSVADPPLFPSPPYSNSPNRFINHRPQAWVPAPNRADLVDNKIEIVQLLPAAKPRDHS